ncbi:MAG: NADH-quinone oxidoreductase subunit C [Telmatospirillum sp.]|nr:NADH-quinone oxidoreductase subunit C [Telmatospirillum sp.]
MIDTLFEGLAVQCVGRCDPAKTGLAWSVFLAPSELLAAARRLYEALYFIEDLTAIDAREGYLLVYHFDHMDKPGRVALRVLIPHDAAALPSIAPVFQGAEWHERETTDFYGIRFDGNPNPVPLLLPPEMTDHPLQKDPEKRAPLATLVAVGDIVRSTADFFLLPPEAPKPEASGA